MTVSRWLTTQFCIHIWCICISLWPRINSVSGFQFGISPIEMLKQNGRIDYILDTQEQTLLDKPFTFSMFLNILIMMIIRWCHVLASWYYGHNVSYNSDISNTHCDCELQMLLCLYQACYFHLEYGSPVGNIFLAVGFAFFLYVEVDNAPHGPCCLHSMFLSTNICTLLLLCCTVLYVILCHFVLWLDSNM